MKKSKHFPNSFYRVSVKGMCVQDDKILLVRESNELSGQWELPGGGLDFGEDIHTGLVREIKEETGLDATLASLSPIYTWTTEFDEKSSRGFGWFYSIVLAYQIKLENLDFVSSKECEAIGWFDKEELQSLDIYRQAKKLREVFNIEDFEK